MASIVNAFRSSENRLRAFVRRLVVNDSDVDDICQETVLRALEAEKQRTIDSPEAFLFGVARNVVRKQLAKQSRSVIDLVDGLAPDEYAADIDNDTLLDIVHVNGWTEIQGKDYKNIPIRLFHNASPNSTRFNERAGEVGIVNDGQGRGIACFDAERDGDIDIVVSNSGPDNVVFYRNESINENHWLGIQLRGPTNNRFGVGARITVSTDDVTQIRELGGKNHYVSHSPFEEHVGLGSSNSANVQVHWPDGELTEILSVDADQNLVIDHPRAAE